MKKLTILFSALLLTAALTGCGSKDVLSVSTETENTSVSENSTEVSSDISSAEAIVSDLESEAEPEESEVETEDSSASAEESSAENQENSTEVVSSESVSASKEESSAEKESSSAEVSSAPTEEAAPISVSAQQIYTSIDAVFQSKYGHGPISNAIELDETILSEKFHITADMAESFAGCISGMMTNCDELVIVQAKEGQLDAVKAALQQALAEQNETFSWYLVMYNGERLDAAKVVTCGNYAALLLVGVSPDDIENDEAVDFSDDVAMAEKAFTATAS